MSSQHPEGVEPVDQPPVVIHPPEAPPTRRVSIFDILERVEASAVPGRQPDVTEDERRRLAEVNRLAAELRTALAALETPPGGPGPEPSGGPGGPRPPG